MINTLLGYSLEVQNTCIMKFFDLANTLEFYHSGWEAEMIIRAD